MKYADAILGYQEQIVQSIIELIRIKSVKAAPMPGMPFGQGCADALAGALKLAAELGLETENIDGYAGHAQYGEGEEIVGVLNHLDVVPEGTGWSVPPYEGIVRDGRIIGRGASDNKGPAVVSLYCLKAIKDLGIPLKRRIRVILGTDEESGWADMAYYFKSQPLPVYGFSPDAAYPIYNREKGILNVKLSIKGSNTTPILSIHGGVARNSVPDTCECRLDTEKIDDVIGFLARVEKLGGITARNGRTMTLWTAGKSAHGASPSEGDNAVSHMLEILSPLFQPFPEDPVAALLRLAWERIGFETDGKSLCIASHDEPSGDLTLNLGLFDLEGDEASFVVDIRFPVTDQMENIMAVIQKETAAYGRGIKVVADKFTKQLYVPDESPLIRTLSGVYESCTGRPAELMSMGGGTYARVLNNNGVAFGPAFPGSEDTHVHQPDEFCVIDELMQHARICLEAMIELANL